jgi:mercuric ion transport protein
MKAKFAAVASVITAFLASFCCIGLALLIPLGLSGLAGTLALTFYPYRMWFIVGTLLFLTIAHSLLWRQKHPSPQAKKILWVSPR